MALYRVCFSGEVYVEADSAEDAWVYADISDAEVNLDEIQKIEE